MSEENVERVRAVWDVLLRGDDTALSAYVDPDVVFEGSLLPDQVGQTYRGPDEVLKAWAAWLEPWESVHTELEGARGAGDVVVSAHLARGRGKGSGVEAEMRYAYLWKLRAGKVVYLRAYPSAARALMAAGIPE